LLQVPLNGLNLKIVGKLILTLSVWSIFVDSREVRLGFGGFKVSGRRQHCASGVKLRETVNGPRWKKMQISICNNGVLSALEKHSGVQLTCPKIPPVVVDLCTHNAILQWQNRSLKARIPVFWAFPESWVFIDNEVNKCQYVTLKPIHISGLMDEWALWAGIPICDPIHESTEVGRWMNGLWSGIHSLMPTDSVQLVTVPTCKSEVILIRSLLFHYQCALTGDNGQQFLEPLSDHWHLGCVTTHQSGSQYTSPSLLWRLSTCKFTRSIFWWTLDILFQYPLALKANNTFIGQSRDHQCRVQIAALIITREQEVASDSLKNSLS
jgi:hypothetical protein